MIYYIRLDQERQRFFREGDLMFKNLQEETGALFTLFEASMGLTKLYLSMEKTKIAVRHLLLADGYLQDIIDLLDEKAEAIVRQAGTAEHLDKFKEWKSGAAVMKTEIAALLAEMGLE